MRYRLKMQFPRRNDELDEFKSQINLCEFMASRGFMLDRKQSSRSSAVMRRADGEKLVVARGGNRHWKYFNVHDDRDKGTIIDFVQVRDNCSLGEVRKILRAWVGGSEFFGVSRMRIAELAPSEHDAARVHAAWDKATPIQGTQDYLEQERGIPRHVLADPVFANRIRTDHRQNALFAHFNSDGLCGFEIKNRGFTGFSPGGLKGLFRSRPRPDDGELIVCETAIDALSYAALFGVERKRFVSTAGQTSPAQKRMLQTAARNMPPGASIVLAMDNDPGGRKLVKAIEETFEETDLTDKSLVVRLPERDGDDWNDVLQRTKNCYLSVPIPAS